MSQNGRPVVLIADKLAQSTVDALGDGVEVRWVDGPDRPALLAAVPDAHALLVRSATTVDAEVLAAATNLKIVGRAGVGLDNVDIAAATERGVMVVNAPIYSADFDLDGDVDGDDLTQWEGDFGVNDLSDADGDGDSDGADFLAWQQQLGSVPTVAAASAVPEPRAILLLTMATAGLLGRWRPCPEGERPGFLAAR